MLNPGDVIHIYCRFIKPSHYKFAVCVCPENNWFFFINSEPWTFKPDAQVLVKHTELEVLNHDSYIDTAMFCFFRHVDVENADHKGRLPNTVMKRIRDSVEKHGHLPGIHREIVMNNFVVG